MLYEATREHVSEKGFPVNAKEYKLYEEAGGGVDATESAFPLMRLLLSKFCRDFYCYVSKAGPRSSYLSTCL